MTLPSKELLSAVLNKKAYWCDTDFFGNLLVHLDQERYLSKYDTINIYELTHMMKEWAWGNGFILTSKKSYFGEWSCRIHIKLESESFTPKVQDIIISDYEFEAVTKACEWILSKTDA